jgi:tRNA(Ile)-lysidine synthase
MNNLIKKTQTYSKRFNLWKNGSRIIVGVSGGPDSICLLDVLNKLKEKQNLEIVLAHVNYGLRGKESEKDEKFVEKLSQQYGLELEKIKVTNVKKESSNLESKLRDLRFDFFERIRKERDFDVVAIAHNQDDQAETLLMRIMRGAGLQGLGSMRPRNGKIVRPFLKVSRDDILEYIKINDLDYRVDNTNDDVRFFRNKIRHDLLPYLEKKYNISIKEILSGAATNIASDYDFINKKSEKKAEKICKVVDDGKVEISVGEIKKLHPSLQNQVLRRAILSVKKDLLNIENSHIEEIVKVAMSEKGKSQKLKFKKLKVVRKGDKITIVI